MALETPILWRAISLSHFNIPPQRWLERSRCCPLSLHFDDKDPVCSRLHITEILAAIVPHRARLAHLALSLSSPTLLDIIKGPMPLLRHLDLTLTNKSDTIFSFCEVPLLRSVTLDVLAPLNIVLPFAQLTLMSLKFVFRREYAVILPQASTLVHCELGIVSDGIGDLAPDHDIELQYLESLALSMSAEEPAPGSLDDFIVPPLHNLRLRESFLGPEPFDRLSSFIAKSGCKLQEVFVADRHCTKIGYLRPMSLPKFVGNQWEMIGLESEECGERVRGVQQVCSCTSHSLLNSEMDTMRRLS
ncbi:hypothetical protein K438DRAFT_2099561 [Mycena galopus ATCC 62051]|nr:hypothetical protein K438DRAFT_2099561 [Mycena galopus ATCC 62051]